MENELKNLHQNVLKELDAIESLKTLEEKKVELFGRSGKLTTLLKQLATAPKEDKPRLGKLVNEVKQDIEKKFQTKETQLQKDAFEKKTKYIDKTNPGIPPNIGHIHPMTKVLSDVVSVFQSIGFQAADGPEIETDHFNFEVLNIGKDHPARDTQMTFYLDTRNSRIDPGEIILRTQTSAMQGRIMQQTKPPVRVIVPGKNFRYEQVDASHGFEFWQVEGFCVDKHITLTDLFGTITYVLKQLMGEDAKLKFATTNFPFVEPGVDTYIACTVCKGSGCSFCKMSGWSEIMPAGMIHPHVLKAVGYNPEEVQGFAFAIGLSRLVTLRYQMDDLRLLTNPDMRILTQF